MFVRRIATVTISAPEATIAARVSSKSRYLPVPTSSRERYARPATISGSARAEGSEGAFIPAILRSAETRSLRKAADRARLCARMSANVLLRVPGAAVSVDPTPRTRPRHPLRKPRPLALAAPCPLPSSVSADPLHGYRNELGASNHHRRVDTG